MNKILFHYIHSYVLEFIQPQGQTLRTLFIIKFYLWTHILYIYMYIYMCGGQGMMSSTQWPNILC